MSETTQSVVTDAGERVEVTFTDDLQRLLHNRVVEQINTRNSLVAQVNAAKGDPEDLRNVLVEKSEDPEIVKLREVRDEAILRLDTIVGPMVAEQIANAEGVAVKYSDEIKDLDKKVRSAISLYKAQYGDESAKVFPAITRQKGAAAGSTSGGRRIRGFSAEVEVDGEKSQHENLSSVAKFLSVDTSALQSAFFEAAGTEDLKKAPDTFEFPIEFTETDDEGNDETATATITMTRVVKED